MNNVLNLDNVCQAHELGKDDENWDFNCWGATLFSLGKRKTLSWVKQETMEKFLEDQTEVISGWPLQPGDILVLWGDESRGNLIHTAVYVSGDSFFHKQGGDVSAMAKREEIEFRYWEASYSEIRRLKT